MSRLVLEVERQRLLVAVGRHEVRRLALVALADERRPPAAGVVAAVGVSTLITRAPRSPSIIAACGPARARVRSTTRTPVSGPSVVARASWPTVPGPSWPAAVSPGVAASELSVGACWDGPDDDVHPPPRPRRPLQPPRRSTPPSRRWSPTRAGRCSCSPGPGTGKTTTMVEAVVDLVDRRGVRPGAGAGADVQPQGGRAAPRPGDRPARAARSGRPLSSTFHSFAYSLVRQLRRQGRLLRAAAAAERRPAGRRAARPARGRRPEAVPWPDVARRGGPDPRLRPRGAAAAGPGPRARPRAASSWRPRSAEAGRPEWVAAGRFLEQYLDVLDAQSALDYADLVVRAVGLAEQTRGPGASCAAATRWVFVDEYQDTDPEPGGAAPGAGRRRAQPRGRRRPRPVDLRLPRCRGARDPRLPRPTFRTADGAPAPGRRAADHPPVRARRCSRPPGGSPPRSRSTGAIPARGVRGVPRAAAGRGRARAGRGRGAAPRHRRAPRSSTSPTGCAAPTSRTACRWSEMAVLVRSGRSSIPALRRGLIAAGVPVEVAADDTPLMAEPAVQPLLEALRVAHQPAATTTPQHPHYVDADRARGAADLPARRAWTLPSSARWRGRSTGGRRQPPLRTSRRPRSERASWSARRCSTRSLLARAAQRDRGVDKARRLGALLQRARTPPRRAR